MSRYDYNLVGIGGETVKKALVDQLYALSHIKKVLNLYGPTETTIWSSAWRVREGFGAVSIGRPIANTRIYIVGASGQPTLCTALPVT